MTGSTTPCRAEPGPRAWCPPQARSRPKLAGLAAVPAVQWDAIPRNPLPHIEQSCAATGRDALDLANSPSLVARLKALSPDDQLRSFLDDLSSVAGPERDVGLGLSDCEAFAAGLPLEPHATKPISQAHMQALIRDFHRRQRQASMLVAGCIATSFVLTIAGIVTLASFARPAPMSAVPVSDTSTPVVRQGLRQVAPEAGFILASAKRDNAAKAAPPLPSPGTTVTAPVLAAPQLILVKANRPLALAPLLSPRRARYLLLRGLPQEAKLSAGRRNPTGAWFVKEKDVAQLTLSIGGAASGDYPVEVYALGASNAPQARQRLVFRVEPARAPTTAPPPESPSPAATAVTADASPLMARAMRLLGEGDIAGARLLFMHLADRGESEAAYKLARTFDAQALAELGARGISADRTRALDWYERASENGNVKAAERLKILASLSD